MVVRFSGYQPHYFPRLHYFARALNSDIFGISDYLQYVRKHAFPASDGSMKQGFSHQAHSPIKLHQGKTDLGIPTRRTGLNPINKTLIDYNQHWVHKHLGSIRTAYNRAPFFQSVYAEIEQILSRRYDNLAQLTVTTILWGLARILDIRPLNIQSLSVDAINQQIATGLQFRLKHLKLLSATDISPPQGEEYDANDWIIRSCERFGAKEYVYGGTAASAYMDQRKYQKAGIRLIKQDWICRPYNQQYHRLGFLPNLSIIDLLMNEGLTRTQEILEDHNNS